MENLASITSRYIGSNDINLSPGALGVCQMRDIITLFMFNTKRARFVMIDDECPPNGAFKPLSVRRRRKRGIQEYFQKERGKVKRGKSSGLKRKREVVGEALDVLSSAIME